MKQLKMLLLASMVLLFTACGGGGSSGGDNVNTTPDTTAPVITIIGANPDTAILNTLYFDMGATATDNIDGDISVSSAGTVDTSTLGQYKIIYSATDKVGNTSSETRIVNVIDAPDTIPPVITLNGDNPMHLLQDDIYNEEGATAVDSIDGNVPVSVTGAVDTSIPETYTVTYTAEDTSSNQATAQRTVIVEPVTTHYVSDTPELRQALLDAAQNSMHDKIILADGVYKTTDDGGGTFVFLDNEPKTLYLLGGNSSTVTLDGDNIDQVFNNNSSGYGPLRLENLSVIDGNSTWSYGGGGVFSKTDIEITNCKFSNNHAGGNNGDGGGLSAISKTIIKNTIFEDNTANDSGGGFRSSGDIIIISSHFNDNIATNYGGGFDALSGSTRIENSIFENNYDRYDGGAFNVGSRSLYVVNNLMIDNSGGVKIYTGITNVFLNNIFKNNNNMDISGSADVVVTAENNYIDEANILTSSFTENNIFDNTNIGFIDGSNGDYHLDITSDLIDAGTSNYDDITYFTIPTTDLDGNLRPIGASTDIGPYEYQP